MVTEDGRAEKLYQEFLLPERLLKLCAWRAMAKRVKSSLSLDTVNEAIVDALIEAKGIGQKIRRLRLKAFHGSG